MVRNRIENSRRWIETQSLGVRIGILIVALIAFRISQIFASTADTMSDVGLIVVGIPVIILAIASLYTIGVTLWSFVSDIRGRRESA